MHPKIPTNADGQFLSSKEIRIKADRSKTQDVTEAIPNLILYDSSSLENSAEKSAKDIN
ncbi:6502_t:CDS:2 [Cetraspora pellucida]|uniref:6502_t:CDS:1 n=1 Tax=Cetraspora pellucida TaxID=1433469 RepID=A0A9N9J0B0_9GLOM|nr:6502_t:CDS:2 [Cetraspora pellucida]